MKKIVKLLITTLFAAVIAVPVIATAACNSDDDKTEHVDYVSQLTLDFTSDTKKQEVEVKLYIDGDTTHFNLVSGSKLPGCDNAADFTSGLVPTKTKGYVKARYLAINTPESTGQIEEWGKAASNFTKEKLKGADKIIIESNDSEWHVDSTGDRVLLWVWYNTKADPTYRNLNVEILQAGLAFGSATAEGRYGEIAKKALDQAEAEKLYVYSGETDPDYYYGGPINVDLKELRFNVESYVGKKVVVEGLVVADFSDSCYIEKEFDDVEGYEGSIRIGMPVLHFNVSGKVLDILSVGNYVKVVGVVVFYENGGYYQITDIQEYDRYNKDNPNNCEVLPSENVDWESYTEIDPAEFADTTSKVGVIVNKDGEDELVEMSYREAILGTSVTVSNLTVKSIYTTTNPTSASKGAMTITCTAPDGKTTIDIRTEVFKDENGNVITHEEYDGKVITVKGIIEYFDGGYQIKCHRVDYITIVG